MNVHVRITYLFLIYFIWQLNYLSKHCKSLLLRLVLEYGNSFKVQSDDLQVRMCVTTGYMKSTCRGRVLPV